MLEVYRVQADVCRFARVVLRDPLGFGDRLPDAFSGRWMTHVQEPIRCTIDDRRKPLAHVSGFVPGSLIVSEPVAREMLHWQEAGQLIPVRVDSTLAYAVNITRIYNALDRDASDLEAGRYVFHPVRLGDSLFKIPQTATREILLCHGCLSEDDEFLSTYKRFGLEGLCFERIWALT